MESPQYCQCAYSILLLPSYRNSSEHTSTCKLCKPAHRSPKCTSISSQTTPSLMVMRDPSGLSIQDGRQCQCWENIQLLNSITRTGSTRQKIRRTSSILHPRKMQVIPIRTISKTTSLVPKMRQCYTKPWSLGGWYFVLVDWIVVVVVVVVVVD